MAAQSSKFLGNIYYGGREPLNFSKYWNQITPTPGSGAGCQVSYVVNQWNNGFTSNVTIKNTGSTAINGWTLAWTFTGNQQITSAWSATISPSTGSVSAKNLSYNTTITAGGTQSFGFQATYSGSNPTPTSFTLNGTPCTIVP